MFMQGAAGATADGKPGQIFSASSSAAGNLCVCIMDVCFGRQKTTINKCSVLTGVSGQGPPLLQVPIWGTTSMMGWLMVMW